MRLTRTAFERLRFLLPLLLSLPLCGVPDRNPAGPEACRTLQYISSSSLPIYLIIWSLI